MKYSAVKLTKCVYDLYVDNYKILIKKIKAIKKCKSQYVHVRLNKDVSSPQTDKQANPIPIKI